MIESAELRTKLGSSASQFSERAVQELKRLPADTKAKAVAARVVKEVEAGGKKKLTSTLVRKHVDKELGVKRGASAPKKPKLSFKEAVRRWAGDFDGIATQIEAVPDDALELFGEENPMLAEELASAVERLQKSLERVWATLP